MEPELYEALAMLLTYPVDARSMETGVLAFRDRLPDAAAAELALLAEEIGPMALHERQELFIQTFDLNPVCSLEMGWHLFGENYDRGLLLVKMRQLLRRHEIVESAELPDHLTNGLRLLARMEREDGAYLAEAIVLPALTKMLDAIREKTNPYEHLLRAATTAVRADFPEIPAEPIEAANPPELRVLA